LEENGGIVGVIPVYRTRERAEEEHPGKVLFAIDVPEASA